MSSFLPKSSLLLPLANALEQVAYNIMLMVMMLDMHASLLDGYTIVGMATILHAFFPLLGGIFADKTSIGRAMNVGLALMVVGYAILLLQRSDGASFFIYFLSMLIVGTGRAFFTTNIYLAGTVTRSCFFAGLSIDNTGLAILHFTSILGKCVASVLIVPLYSWLKGMEFECISTSTVAYIMVMILMLLVASLYCLSRVGSRVVFVSPADVSSSVFKGAGKRLFFYFMLLALFFLAFMHKDNVFTDLVAFSNNATSLRFIRLIALFPLLFVVIFVFTRLRYRGFYPVLSTVISAGMSVAALGFSILAIVTVGSKFTIAQLSTSNDTLSQPFVWLIVPSLMFMLSELLVVPAVISHLARLGGRKMCTRVAFFLFIVRFASIATEAVVLLTGELTLASFWFFSALACVLSAIMLLCYRVQE